MYDAMFSEMHTVIGETDPEIAGLIRTENTRQKSTICLIPSENYTSAAVALALSSQFTNKYSEGYPHMWKEGMRDDRNGRYYQGQDGANGVERIAIDRAVKLFAGDSERYHANVQALSGAPANLAVLSAFLKPGDTFMGLALDFGGHLTHGHKISVTSQYYRAVQYTLNAKGELDYAQIEALAKEHRPKLIICGATAYPLTIDFERFGKIAKSVNAVLVADISHICGLCIAGAHPHPFPHADVITSTTHKILRGPRAGVIVCKREFGAQVDKAVFPGLQGGPHMNTIAAMAVAFKEAMSDEYKAYAHQVVKNAALLAKHLADAGFRLVSGGTQNHLILMDVVGSANGLSVKNGSFLATKLEAAGIVANKNSIPGDPKPFVPSGVRLGTPAVTTLGMKEPEMKRIAEFIVDATRNADNDAKLAAIKADVAAFMAKFTANSKYVC